MLPTIVSNGSGLVDFCGCGFDCEMVCAAGEDGRVKVWKVKGGEKGDGGQGGESDGNGGESGDAGSGGGECIAELDGMEKVIQVEWHPFVQEIIAILCTTTDSTAEIRLWEYKKGQNYRSIPLSYIVLPSPSLPPVLIHFISILVFFCWILM